MACGLYYQQQPPPRSEKQHPLLLREPREPSAFPSSQTEGRDADAEAVEDVSYGGGASSCRSPHRSGWCCWSSSSPYTGTVCRWTSCAFRPGTCAANAAPFFYRSIIATLLPPPSLF
ncbi:hypothetical protein CGRA01v4_13256 [Colletotrichum graminicola]|nr:hypothetical protein CGRA01v4_13256 [Colletotrichum graminicola]